jgi:cation transport regulator ChaC
MLYFAYGSNLNLDHLADYLTSRGVPWSAPKRPSIALLPDHRIRTNYFSTAHQAGACNVEPAAGRTVEGVVWEVTEDVRSALRRKEGYPRCYEEVEIQVIIPSTKKIVPAFTYLVNPVHRLDRNLPVTREYRQLILDGAKAVGLSTTYQTFLRHMLKQLPDTDVALVNAE